MSEETSPRPRRHKASSHDVSPILGIMMSRQIGAEAGPAWLMTRRGTCSVLRALSLSLSLSLSLF